MNLSASAIADPRGASACSSLHHEIRTDTRIFISAIVPGYAVWTRKVFGGALADKDSAIFFSNESSSAVGKIHTSASLRGR